jgi:hypothetical protein
VLLLAQVPPAPQLQQHPVLLASAAPVLLTLLQLLLQRLLQLRLLLLAALSAGSHALRS